MIVIHVVGAKSLAWLSAETGCTNVVRPPKTPSQLVGIVSLSSLPYSAKVQEGTKRKHFNFPKLTETNNKHHKNNNMSVLRNLLKLHIKSQ